MNIDRRRIGPIAVIALFMAVTISHVATYVGQFEPPGVLAWAGWPYALAVDLAIVVCSYFTRWETTDRWAWVGYFAFVVASGVMNAGHVRPWDRPDDAWAAWVFALFPTGAIALCGFLYSKVDKLTANAEKRRGKKDEREAQPVQVLPQHSATLPERLPAEARRAQLLALWAQDPCLTRTELAPRFDVSRQTIGNDAVVLQGRGKIRYNGDGLVEVLP